MPHYYSPKTGGRFTMAHPDWPKTKKGEPHKRPGAAKVLAAGGHVGVTDRLSGYGQAFWMKKYFGEMGIAAAMESFCWREDEIPYDKWEEYATSLFAEMADAPASAGKDFHSQIDDYLCKGIEPEDEAMLKACRNVDGVLADLGLDKSEGVFEQPFCQEVVSPFGTAEVVGGTPDYLQTSKALLDWKSCVKRDRAPRESEPAQAAIYADMNGVPIDDPDCIIGNVYIHQETGDILQVRLWTPEELQVGLDFYWHCHRGFDLYSELGNMVKS